MHTKNFIRACFMLVMVTWIYSCKKTEVPDETFQNRRPPHAGFNENNTVLEWNEHAVRVISRSPANPPYAARHLSMTQLAVHDALNSIVPKYQTYALMNERDKYADPDAAVAAAAYWTLIKLDAYMKTLPPNVGLALQTAGNDWDGWYAATLAQIPDGDGKMKGVVLGMKAAEAIMAKRANDGFEQGRPVYLPGSGVIPEAGVYRPTIAQNPPIPFPTTHLGALPYWGKYVKGFALTSSSQFRSDAPPALSSSQYAEDYNEVKTVGARVGSTRTPEQSLIANYWQEGPGSIWNRYARAAILTKNMDAWRSARLLALVNVAIFDGLLASFESAHFYYRWRPESAIRSMQDDGNPATSGQPDWLPFVTDIKIGPAPQTPTPPLPEYPNTNITLGRAATEVMANFFGTDETDITMATEDVTVPGTSRHFSSFSGTSWEYGQSRIFAGFAFRYSIVAGDKMGKQVGETVFNTILKEN